MNARDRVLYENIRGNRLCGRVDGACSVAWWLTYLLTAYDAAYDLHCETVRVAHADSAPIIAASASKRRIDHDYIRTFLRPAP